MENVLVNNEGFREINGIGDSEPLLCEDRKENNVKTEQLDATALKCSLKNIQGLTPENATDTSTDETNIIANNAVVANKEEDTECTLMEENDSEKLTSDTGKLTDKMNGICEEDVDIGTKDSANDSAVGDKSENTNFTETSNEMSFLSTTSSGLHDSPGDKETMESVSNNIVSNGPQVNYTSNDSNEPVSSISAKTGSDVKTETVKEKPKSAKEKNDQKEDKNEQKEEKNDRKEEKTCPKACAESVDFEESEDSSNNENNLTNGQDYEKGEDTKTTENKELPEWFKMMIGLTHGIHDGKEMEHWEDIRESIDIHGSTQATTIRTNQRLVQLIMKRINRITRRDRRLCSCLPNFEHLKRTFHNRDTMDLGSLVQSILKPLTDIDDVDISCERVRAPCHTGGSTLLHIRCTSCQSLYRVVAVLNSPLFKDGIVRIKDCLEQEMKDKLDVQANITPESITDIKNHLREQGILNGIDSYVSCGAHPGKLTEVYCFEHDDICCMACGKSQHSSCHDVAQVTTGSAEEKKRPTLKRKVKEHNVRIHSDNSDEGNCDIISCCMLPHGEILLADMNNRRLKRLNKSLKVIDVCDLPDCPRDVCYLGNHRVAVILFDHSIQFVDISGTPELREKVDLDHDCFGVTCCGDTLYVTDPMSVYMYTLEGKEKGGLYRQLEGRHRFSKITVSENKDKLYISAREGGLVTIDFEGKRLSSLRGRELGIVSDVCVADDGTLLVCNSRMQTVSRVDAEGKTVLEKVAGRSEDMYMPQSLCYDRQGGRLIVGHLHDDYISVLQLV